MLKDELTMHRGHMPGSFHEEATLLEGKHMQDKDNSQAFEAAAAQRAGDSDQAPETSSQTVNGKEQSPPTLARRSGGRWRTGALVIGALGLLLALAVGIFGGIQIGRNSTSGTGTVRSQPNVSTQPEQVAASFMPSVVQINVVTQ